MGHGAPRRDAPGLTAADEKIRADPDAVLAYLERGGVPREGVAVSSVSTDIRYGMTEKGAVTNRIEGFVLEQTVRVSSGDIPLVTRLARDSTGLIKDGIEFSSLPPSYYYTKLNDLKIAMLGEATKDAKTRAEQLALHSGCEVGALRSASQGVFQITPEYSKGIYALESVLQAQGGKRPYVKVQTTGPMSFGLTIVDENKRAIFYNPEFVDVVVKALSMKCRWQIRKFQPYAEQIICFIDEPILSAFGSSTYVSVSRDDVVAKLNEVVEAVHAEGALAGVHCCGNTEWSILMDAGVDIVNFDAFDFGDTIALYPQAVKAHLEAGKVLAWGVVPTNSAKIQQQTVESLIAKFDEGVDNLAKAAGISRELIIQQAIVTPSCGTGSLPVADAELVFSLLGQLSTALQQRL